MTSQTSAGTKIAISATLPATYDSTGFAALTATEIGGVESIPAFGPATTVNSFQPLNGPQEKHKGPTNYGSLALPFARNATDAGQILLKTAADPADNTERAFIITFSDGTKAGIVGRVFNFLTTIGSATNVLMGSSTIEINKKPVDIAS